MSMKKDRMMLSKKKQSLWAVVLFCALGAVSGTCFGGEQTAQAAKEWLTKYYDTNSRYVIFPNDQIFTARAKWTGIALGTINLWHCFGYLPLRVKGDENIYLRARVIAFLDKDAEQVAATYRTQCALKSYSRDLYETVAPKPEDKTQIIE